MKKGLILLFFAITLSISGATYYVSPTGNDGAAGTQSAPWLSWNYAFNRLSAGDILYVRGGTYTNVLGGAAGAYFGVRVANRNGTSSNPIKVMASPGEVPVLDCSGLTPYAGAHYGMILDNCDYWYIKGLTVKSVREYSSGGTFPYTGSGWELTASTYITLEQCSVTDCMNGFSLNSFVNYIYYINCDSYKNYDNYDNGGLCNGFNGNVNAGSQVFYTGCRAYSNSDDGFDNMAGGGYMTYTNCWAWRNGYDIPMSGDGDGFKLGFTTKGDEAGVQRTLYNCIAANNKLMGFDESMDATTSMDMALYNCIAYSNSNDFGFRFSHSSGTGVTTLKNNVSYLSRSGANYEGRSRNISNHNSWDAGAPAVSNADFVNVDWTELARPRKADGSLPDVNFLHLATGSDLIDAGVDAGIAFSGKAPDLGAFETQTGSTPTPLYVSSAIGNSTPSLLEMTYNMTLADVIPGTSAFSVRVNSVTRTVNAVTVSASKVLLTLASPIVSGDLVTISYTKPSDNPLQTAAGGLAANIVSQPVVNNLRSVAPEVVITYPVDQMSFTAPANIIIKADASDYNGSVTTVEFYNGNTKLGSAAVAPYSFNWNGVGTGTYTLTAVATDNQKIKTTSSPITITVTSKPDTVNQPPVVIISNPSKGTQFADSATIDIEVVANDPDGIITKVELFSDSTKLVELTSAPYLYSLKDIKAGTYSIQAIAYDNLNATATSGLIDFKVVVSPIYDVNSEIIKLYPNPNNGNFSVEILKPIEDEKCKIVITDLGGKQVSNTPILKEATLMHFDTSDIKSGIYVMMVIGKGILVTKKFIKQ
jgi:uncharacterized repeat protein (TIGR02059 family)